MLKNHGALVNTRAETALGKLLCILTCLADHAKSDVAPTYPHNNDAGHHHCHHVHTLMPMSHQTNGEEVMHHASWPDATSAAEERPLHALDAELYHIIGTQCQPTRRLCACSLKRSPSLIQANCTFIVGNRALTLPDQAAGMG